MNRSEVERISHYFDERRVSSDSESSVKHGEVVFARKSHLLDDKGLKSEDFEKITISDLYLLTRCGKLRCGQLHLDLSGKSVEQSLKRRIEDSDLSCICGFLKKNPNIVYLNLSYNSVTSNGFAYLAYYLAEDENLKSLNLVHNEIMKISECVVRNTTPLWKLKCLILTGNKFGKEGGVQIANILKLNTSITHLDIGETDQNIQSISSIIESLLPYQNYNQTLKKIDLARMIPNSCTRRFNSSHFCTLFSYVIIYNKSLVEIHLAKNEIGDTELEELLGALKTNKVLQVLNLMSNRLTSCGLENLAAILPESRISVLMLAFNEIGNDGVIALGRSIRSSNLKVLDISHNKVEDTGFISLYHGIRSSRRFERLFFLGNPISVKTRMEVFRYLRPTAMNVIFVWDEEDLIFLEDITGNTYTASHYSVPSLETKEQSFLQRCCH